MQEKLALLASVAVLAVAGIGLYYLADVDRAEIAQLNQTVKTINKTLGGKVPESKPDNTKTVLYSGIAILFLAALFLMLKKGK